ncbi:MAG: hypothetical protein QXO71_02305 [Candidatus Jordarchaeaceae archaeon]
MREKLKTVTTCILILLAVTLGTHIPIQSTQTINNYLPTPGLVYTFPVTQKNQNTIQGTSTNPNSLESLNIISTSIDRIQDTINFTGRAFMEWQLQKMLSGEMKPFISPPSNESAIRLFYQFLSEKPEYAEHFRLYDQLLSRENQLRIPERSSEMQSSFDNIHLIVERG